MGEDGTGLKGGGGSGRERGGLPSGAARSRIPRGRQVQKTLNNLKITVLCGFVTILVLRGTIGVGNLGGSSPAEAEAEAEAEAKVVEDIERILREIRSDSDPDDDDDDRRLLQSTSPLNSTSASAANYTLGPKISDWDEQRRVWLSRNPGFPRRTAAGKRGSSSSPDPRPIPATTPSATTTS
ncbi:putative xyloglucan 6-xylosyltransferase 5 [Ananas comosus]|uniref:Putative xyloglucan 6-xylosyltransferase 5 n=1 Tax=Ananas comosus TaxID=4615 RepID=A0A199USK0_ANACO|nr:putative xyloglucan 6-xylosyltransferase 5 [Ananas comosus]